VRELTGGRGIDIALESIGGDAVDATLQCLAPFGRMVVYGSASGLSSPHSAAVLDRLVYAPAPNQSLCAFNLGGWFAERPAAAVAALTQLVTMVMSGQVRIPPIATFTLGEVRTAHERLEGRETSGKLVVTPWA
jgi:NADPH:quinone reductase